MTQFESKRREAPSPGERRKITSLCLLLSCIMAQPGVAVARSESPVPPVTKYHCDSCRNEFDFTPAQDSTATFPYEDPMMGPKPIKCLRCGKIDAWLMNACYKCGKLFAATIQEHRRDYDGSKTVCPHCWTNQIEYLKEKLRSNPSTGVSLDFVMSSLGILAVVALVVLTFSILLGKNRRIPPPASGE